MGRTISALDSATADKKYMIPVQPFKPNNAALEIIDIVNNGGPKLTELNAVLSGDMTKTADRKKLLEYAIRHSWLKEGTMLEGSKTRVIVDGGEGYDGYIAFRQSFSDALTFFIVSVEGNNRVIALIASLLKTKIEDEMNFTAKKEGDKGYHSGLDDFFKGTGSPNAVKPTTTIPLRLMAAKKQATESTTAERLVREHVHYTSEKASDNKVFSSRKSSASKLLYVYTDLTPQDNDSKVEPPDTNGELYLNKEFLNQNKRSARKKMTKLSQDPVLDSDEFKNFMGKPVPGSAEYDRCFDAFKMRTSEEEFCHVLSPLSLDNLLRKSNLTSKDKSDVSNLSGKKLFFIPILANVLGLTKSHVDTLLVGGFAEDKVMPTIDLPKELKDKFEAEVSRWNLESTPSLNEALLAFMMDAVVAGSVLKKGHIVKEFLTELAKMMTNPEDNNTVAKEIGKQIWII